jgi:hypothetical protein
VLADSKTHFRAFYEQVAEGILIVDTPDHGAGDLTQLPYRQAGSRTQLSPERGACAREVAYASSIGLESPAKAESPRSTLRFSVMHTPPDKSCSTRN